jgi:hypothetical protein
MFWRTPLGHTVTIDIADDKSRKSTLLAPAGALCWTGPV